MRKSLHIGLIGLILGLAACQKSADHEPVIAQAYAGPATLKLRSDIPLQAPTVATVKHGDKLDILQHRRRFLKVRTQRGVEGWTDDRMLLSAAEIAALQDVEKRARALPSQGVASTYAQLNVHTQPNLLSPSFLQIAEGEKFDVVAHVVAERVTPKRQPLIPPKPKTKIPHKQATPRYAPPPMPTPPPPPPNWRDLSQTPPEVEQEIAQAKAEHQAPTDDWTLIRTKEGQSGWALTRRVFMAIPDEVAQYAEGHRITSYFPLDDVQDGDRIKHTWLWTTSTGNGADFDSYRVFIWSVRRHRYETAFIQRNVEGYFPVLLRKVEMSSTAKARGEPAATSYPGFSVCLADGSGQRVRRNYAFIVNVVRFAGEQPCEAPQKTIW